MKPRATPAELQSAMTGMLVRGGVDLPRAKFVAEQLAQGKTSFSIPELNPDEHGLGALTQQAKVLDARQAEAHAAGNTREVARLVGAFGALSLKVSAITSKLTAPTEQSVAEAVEKLESRRDKAQTLGEQYATLVVKLDGAMRAAAATPNPDTTTQLREAREQLYTALVNTGMSKADAQKRISYVEGDTLDPAMLSATLPAGRKGDRMNASPTGKPGPKHVLNAGDPSMHESYVSARKDAVEKQRAHVKEAVDTNKALRDLNAAADAYLKKPTPENRARLDAAIKKAA